MRRIFSLFILLFSVLPVWANQNFQDVIDDWYLELKDGTELYVRTIGVNLKGKAPIVVLHGGFGADHSYLIPAI